MKKPVLSEAQEIKEGLNENAICPDCDGFGVSDGCWTCGKPSKSWVSDYKSNYQNSYSYHFFQLFPLE